MGRVYLYQEDNEEREIMKTVFEYVGAAVIGGAFVFMILWAAFQTDPQYRQPPSYVMQGNDSVGK